MLPREAQALTIAAPGGAVLKGALIPASRPVPGAPVILSFPGNATNAASAALYVHELYPQADVIGFLSRLMFPSCSYRTNKVHGYSRVEWAARSE